MCTLPPPVTIDKPFLHFSRWDHQPFSLYTTTKHQPVFNLVLAETGVFFQFVCQLFDFMVRLSSATGAQTVCLYTFCK